jgi:hypothetical protein
MITPCNELGKKQNQWRFRSSPELAVSGLHTYRISELLPGKFIVRTLYVVNLDGGVSRCRADLAN